MKTKILLIISTLLLIGIMFPQNVFSQKKYFVIFDNFEDQRQFFNGDATITNLFDLCYWDPLRSDVLYGKYAERKSFNAATFAQKSITDYDVAIFVLGVQNHLGSSVDGIKVLDKVKEMVNANKSVILIGYNIIPAAFGQGGDMEARSWLTSWLGIDQPKTINHLIGNEIHGMRVVGIEGDPVSRGYPKEVNRKFADNSTEFRDPIRWYPNSNCFEIKGGKNAVGFDFVREIAGLNVDPSETLITGARAEQGKARVALWTTNFDIANTWHTDRFYNAMNWAVRWMVRDVPHPEGFLSIENETIDFGIVEPNRTGNMQAVIMNNGREPFTISKYEIAGDEPVGSFEIIGGSKKVVMNPGDVHQIDLKFAPKEERFFEDYLTIYSDAINGNVEIKLMGQGGEQAFSGPRLSVTDQPVDFGSVPFGQNSEKNIHISNTGDGAMIIHEITLLDNGGGRFAWASELKVPITVQAGTFYNLKVRYTSTDEEAGNYTGKIAINTNALNSGGQAQIDLVARSAGNKVESGLELSSTSIEFGVVEVNQSTFHVFKIKNIASENRRVFSVTWDPKSGGEDKAQFAFHDNTDKLRPTLAPGEEYNLVIKFTPQAEKDYSVKVFILTNDPANDGVLEIPVSGRGKNPATVKEGTAFIDGLNVKINPTPVSDISTIELSLEMPGNLEMNIIDQTGRKISEVYKSYTNQGIMSRSLDAGSLANGVYFLSVTFNGKQVHLPFVISK